MRHARRLVVFLGFLATLLPACTTIPARTVDKANQIKTVAVLPLINNTNNVDGPAKLQAHLTAGMYERYYDVVEADEVNQKLKDQMGVTLGAQLDMAKPDLLCKTLGADGLLYGVLDDYISKPTGVYTIKRVRARTKLVDCKTGGTVWKGGAGGKSQEATGGNVGAVVGAIGSIGSAISDVSEGELPPLLGDKIEASWFNVPPPPKQSSGNWIADIVIGIAETVMQHAAGVSLVREEYATATTMLDGYFHEPSVSGKTEKGIPSGPTDED
jgi:hypothetical protein